MTGLKALVDKPAYFADGDTPLQQGDIVLAPVSYLEREHELVARWAAFSQVVDRQAVDPILPSFYTVSGYGTCAVVSHDCHMEREFNDKVKELRKEGLSLRDAEASADANPALDRFLSLCPLVEPSHYKASWADISTGRIIGAFPVPPIVNADLPEMVIDLTYRATVDRHLIVGRIASMAESVRAHLRFALARVDAFRNPRVTPDLEDAIGQRIKSIECKETNPLILVLRLADGKSIELVNQPAAIKTTGTRRRLPPP